MHKVEQEHQAQMEAAYAEWHAEHADALYQEEYAEWAEGARQDGEDDSEDAYMLHLEGMMDEGGWTHPDK